MKLKDEFKKQVIAYISGALGMITGLAWNEAIKSVLTSRIQDKSGKA